MGIEELVERLPEMSETTVVIAFEGWNDAGEAATGLVDHLLDSWDSELIGELDPEDYYDFQVNRPQAAVDENGIRRITWPSTELYGCREPHGGPSLLIIRGIEPNVRWRAFTAEIVALLQEVNAGLVVTLGAMLAETPHTRTIPVHATTLDPALQASFGFKASNYEGPTGIIGVISAACVAAQIPTLSLWAAVPHYYAQTPSPKGTLALLSMLEEILDVDLPVGELPEEAHAWELDVQEFTADNDELQAYVRQLESAHDANAPDATSGDAIAKEFERYLRRRDNSQ